MAAERPRRRITQPCLVCIPTIRLFNAPLFSSLFLNRAKKPFSRSISCVVCVPALSIVGQLLSIDHFNNAIETWPLSNYVKGGFINVILISKGLSFIRNLLKRSCLVSKQLRSLAKQKFPASFCFMYLGQREKWPMHSIWKFY